MSLPEFIEYTSMPDGKFIIHHKESSKRIKIGKVEFEFLQFLHTKSGENETFSSLTNKQQEYLIDQFDKLDFLTKEKSVTKKKSFDFSRMIVVKVNPTRFLESMSGTIRILCHPYLIVSFLLLSILPFVVLAANSDVWAKDFFSIQFDFKFLLILYVLVVMTMALHELGHAISCYYFGGEVKRMGIMLFYFQPALYCDISAIYGFTRRKSKILVTSAGLIVQCICSGLALYGYLFCYFFFQTSPIILVYYSFLNLALILLNLIPFIKLDGYWLLTHFLNMTNLRDKSFMYLLSMIIKKFKGYSVSFNKKEKMILASYGVTSFVFTSFFWIYTCFNLYQFVFPYNDIIGIILLIVLLTIMMIHILGNFKRYLTHLNQVNQLFNR